MREPEPEPEQGEERDARCKACATRLLGNNPASLGSLGGWVFALRAAWGWRFVVWPGWLLRILQAGTMAPRFARASASRSQRA